MLVPLAVMSAIGLEMYRLSLVFAMLFVALSDPRGHLPPPLAFDGRGESHRWRTDRPRIRDRGWTLGDRRRGRICRDAGCRFVPEVRATCEGRRVRCTFLGLGIGIGVLLLAGVIQKRQAVKAAH